MLVNFSNVQNPASLPLEHRSTSGRSADPESFLDRFQSCHSVTRSCLPSPPVRHYISTSCTSHLLPPFINTLLIRVFPELLPSSLAQDHLLLLPKRSPPGESWQNWTQYVHSSSHKFPICFLPSAYFPTAPLSQTRQRLMSSHLSPSLVAPPLHPPQHR